MARPRVRRPARRLLRLLRRWVHLSWPERGALVEAIGWLALARLSVRFLGFSWLASSLGRLGVESGDGLLPRDESVARRVIWAVQAAARRTPWENVCLPQSMAVQWMLRRRHIPSTFYLGVKRGERPGLELQAHAWVRCGVEILSDPQAPACFAVVGRFGTSRA